METKVVLCKKVLTLSSYVACIQKCSECGTNLLYRFIEFVGFLQGVEERKFVGKKSYSDIALQVCALKFASISDMEKICIKLHEKIKFMLKAASPLIGCPRWRLKRDTAFQSC